MNPIEPCFTDKYLLHLLRSTEISSERDARVRLLIANCSAGSATLRQFSQGIGVHRIIVSDDASSEKQDQAAESVVYDLCRSLRCTTALVLQHARAAGTPVIATVVPCSKEAANQVVSLLAQGRESLRACGIPLPAGRWSVFFRERKALKNGKQALLPATSAGRTSLTWREFT